MHSQYLPEVSSEVAATQKDRHLLLGQVMELVELMPLRSALVGLPGTSGLSVEQRKRLTIAVELVANPSAVFMDEPTSGTHLPTYQAYHGKHDPDTCSI